MPGQDEIVTLGKVLKLLKIARGYSSKELAEKMGVSSTYISEIESDAKKPTLEMLAKYADALNVKSSTILYFDEELSGKKYKYTKILYEILKKIVEE